jgi:RNA polymerase sigma-B factor
MSTGLGRGTFEAGPPHRARRENRGHMPTNHLKTDAPATTSHNDAAGLPHAPPTGVPAARDPDALLDNAARRGRPPARCNAATARSHHGRNLRRADEGRLFSAARDGDRRAREELVERYLDLARHLARRYQRAAVGVEDLEQVASLALVKAIDAFDLTRGTRFSSYAVPCITGALKRYFRDHTWAVRVPAGLQDLALRIQRHQDCAAAATGHHPTVAEIADSEGVEVEDVVEARLAQRAYRAHLLSQPLRSEEGDEFSLLDTLGELDADLERVVDRAALDAMLGQLEQGARRAVELYYRHELTQSEIAERLGCSQMHISRVLRAALAQLGATPQVA